MKISVPKTADNLQTVMRRVGYSPDPVRRGESLQQEPSFSRPLRGRPYPRFHMYVDDAGKSWVFKLHLDQKKPSYGSHTAHSGEYDGPLVEQEAERIQNILI